MRYYQLTEAKIKISDQERIELIQFIIAWMRGDYMSQGSKDPLVMWQKIHDLFPPRINSPKTLMRLVTLPINYADLPSFHLKNTAPKAVGSWTSTHFGLTSVHGIANEYNEGADTCRIAIRAKIDPKNILASYQSIKKAFLSLTHDYDYYDYEVTHVKKQGGRIVHTTSYLPYLGLEDPQGEKIHDDLGYYQGLFRDMNGGPMRQYEYIIRTTPLDVQNIKVFRRGNENLIDGHDDPHNSGNYRGWSY